MKQKLITIIMLFVLTLTVGGCFGTDFSHYQVTGEIYGVLNGQVVIGDQVSYIDDYSYSINAKEGQQTFIVLDADGNEFYREELLIQQDLIKNLDLSLVGLTPEQLAEFNIKKERTDFLKRNWSNLQPQTWAQDPKKDLVVIATAGSIGSYGDILVTLDGISSSLSLWAGGHAGLVEDSDTVIECFGNKGDLNGVRRWPNDWAYRYDSVDGLRVYGATLSDYTNATTEGVSHVGKPYNYWFFNITTTSSFYCSQLVWRAWYNQGWDLNDGGAVWPVDLIESSYTYNFYVQ